VIARIGTIKTFGQAQTLAVVRRRAGWLQVEATALGNDCRGRAASAGGLRAAGRDLRVLWRTAPLGTPVFIRR
jgi:hypothetical protein